MKTKKYLLNTKKEIPKDTKIISHQLMIRSGMIQKLASGLYSWLPTGVKVLKKIKNLIQKEMDFFGALEVIMPCIIPAYLWKKTKRWEKFGNELLKIKDRKGHNFCFGPTHEEVITDLAKYSIKSYKELPIHFYQIQTKFRDEMRPCFGLIRSREFLMKDSYSFHLNKYCLQKTYKNMRDLYYQIFKKLGLFIKIINADSGIIGGEINQEFHAFTDNTKVDINYISDKKNNLISKDIQNFKKNSINNKNIFNYSNSIEVGHIFQLGEKYTKNLNLSILNQQGNFIYPFMGCYGLGISRTICAIIENNHDKNGIIWPEKIAPFYIAIIPIKYYESKIVYNYANILYKNLISFGFDVLLDNRREQTIVMLKDIDLIGIPHCIVLNEKKIQNKKVEYKFRKTGKIIDIEFNNLINYFKKNIQ